MAGKMLSVELTVDPSAKPQTSGSAPCEVGAATIPHEVTMDDYSYVVNDAQITYTTIGKISFDRGDDADQSGQSPHAAGRRRISPIAPARIFGGRRRYGVFRARRSHHVDIGHDVWIGHGAVVLPGRNVGNWRRHRGRRNRDQGRSGLHHRRRKLADRQAPVSEDVANPPVGTHLVGLGP
jgi:hypothetical protein